MYISQESVLRQFVVDATSQHSNNARQEVPATNEKTEKDQGGTSKQQKGTKISNASTKKKFYAIAKNAPLDHAGGCAVAIVPPGRLIMHLVTHTKVYVHMLLIQPIMISRTLPHTTDLD